MIRVYSLNGSADAKQLEAWLNSFRGRLISVVKDHGTFLAIFAPETK